ncbi:hypothetical protein NHX12_009550 [Muraenolepis orangiensis]|uniref:Uncharacterized protein n=1 Tax=Muraenolepis orangiensis TaxID=630683 RepID=A0A9Q0DI05_9TELE|nr:hypothetical protein NHX12_009550 [Muraenolepis orangiensis]
MEVALAVVEEAVGEVAVMEVALAVGEEAVGEVAVMEVALAVGEEAVVEDAAECLTLFPLFVSPSLPIVSSSRPGLLKAGDQGLPWLADSWPSTSLPANGALGSPKGSANFGRGDVLPAATVEKTGTMLSDGAIYSSIDFMGKAGYGSSPSRAAQPTPYATTQILQSSSFHELAVDRPDPRWKASLQAQQEMASLGYSLTDRRPCNGGKPPAGGKRKKSRAGSKTPKSGGSCWSNAPLPPPPMHPLPGTEVHLDRYPPPETVAGRYDSDSWAPPLSIQTYLHPEVDPDGGKRERGNAANLPIKGRTPSPMMTAPSSFGHSPSASLSSGHHEEMQSILQAHLDELTRAYQYEVAKQTWHMKGSPSLSKNRMGPRDYMSSTLGSDLGTTLLMDGLESTGSSGSSADSGPLGTQSLGPKRSPGFKPQGPAVGTLPRTRDGKTDALNSLGRMHNSSWASASSDPSEECMVTVSTLEREHMASWGPSVGSRGTLGRGPRQRPHPDHHTPAGNPHPPSGRTERREHCCRKKLQSSRGGGRLLSLDDLATHCNEMTKVTLNDRREMDYGLEFMGRFRLG